MKQIAILVVILLLAACTPFTQGNTAIPTDKLAEIQARGTLVVATDASYTPQSQLMAGSYPPADTKCKPMQYSANQFEGFDVDVAAELAAHLGVESCFVTPPWSQLVAGHWGDNWDIHVGSVAITFDRMQDLYFSTPYYATPTVLLVHKDNTSFQKVEDLSGKRIGSCVACTFEAYLTGTLKMPGQEIQYRIHDPKTVAYEKEDPAIEDLSLGDGVELDAVMTILPKAKAAMAAGKPIKILDEPVIFAYASVTFDRSANRSNFRLWSEINRIVQELHASGRLTEISIQYQGVDLTRAAASYDIHALNQFP
jgi:polar amino acid transport system substrate-binding protein